MKPTSTQIGAISENLVANALMVESGGRLSPFSPVADDDGIDILIYDKKTGRAIPTQVKSRTKALKKKGSQARGNVVHFEIRTGKIKKNDFTYLIAILLSDDMAAIECAWLIPMNEVRRLGSKRETKVVLRASKSRTSSDKYTKFRCANAAELVAKVLNIFDG